MWAVADPKSRRAGASFLGTGRHGRAVVGRYTRRTRAVGAGATIGRGAPTAFSTRSTSRRHRTAASCGTATGQAAIQSVRAQPDELLVDLHTRLVGLPHVEAERPAVAPACEIGCWVLNIECFPCDH